MQRSLVCALHEKAPHARGRGLSHPFCRQKFNPTVVCRGLFFLIYPLFSSSHTHTHTHLPRSQKKKKNARRQRETDSATFDRFSPACIFDTHKTQRHTFEHRYTVPLAIPSGGKTSVRTRPNFAGFDRISTTSSFPVATRRGEETKRAYKKILFALFSRKAVGLPAPLGSGTLRSIEDNQGSTPPHAHAPHTQPGVVGHFSASRGSRKRAEQLDTYLFSRKGRRNSQPLCPLLSLSLSLSKSLEA